MKTLNKLTCLVFAGASLASCNRPELTQAPFSKESIAAHIKTLSSDEFMGRKPFTAGETKTIAYLEEEFKKLGLEPGNGNSFLQDVPLVEITPTASATMLVTSPKGNFTLKGFDDYVIWTQRTDAKVSLDNDELVFAGYGIVAPELGWNDYAGLDVKGKVVLVMVNDPDFGTESDTTLFKGNTMTYYGRWTYKFEEAARQGAKGCLIIHDTAGASYGFNVIQNNWNAARLNLESKDYQCAAIGWVTGPTGKKLFEAAGLDTMLMVQAKQKGFKPVPMNLKLAASMQVKVKKDLSHNVVGKITGSKHPEELIIYSAHWDHLGIGKPNAKGDSINNGALDNASGTASLMEIAKVFKSLDPRPERTIVFLSVTAEEQGLLGAAWYSKHPIYPASQTVANINMDGMNVHGKTKDIVVVGVGQSELEDMLREEAGKKDRYVAPEPHPEAGYYFRSDHFNFAKIGIPALYLENGIDVIGKGKEYGKQMADDYTKNYYHQPSDEFNPGWNYDGAIDDLELLFNVGKRLAFSDKWPQWKPESEFKAIRDKEKK
ncbi:M28 family metallopeptidase [Hufsiella ginkgonis]|uniref:M28 family peptidase n=1 Tax=Hufsiella ginkgonis TaxID=2695274 RepID=A0A7K1Y4N4_9SPHI|nr:M28 family metallopeptidase [Hufsiella ginkgonis]MXV17817.1 M28 family peptidase [Hufsiella ginkgonis]